MAIMNNLVKEFACISFVTCSLGVFAETVKENTAATAANPEAKPAAGDVSAAPAAAPDAAAAEEAAAIDPKAPQAKQFESLIRVINIRGVCEVNNEDLKGFVAAKDNKAYPLSTIFRTGPQSSAMLLLSASDTIFLFENAEVMINCTKENPLARTVLLSNGKVRTNIRDNVAEGFFAVYTPDFTCKNIAGRAEFTLSRDTNAETVRIGVTTGLVVIDGAHYQITGLRAANIIEISTGANRMLTRIDDVFGDYPIILANGMENPVTFPMQTKSSVKIWREKAPVGGRDIVTTLAMSPSGTAIHRFAFAQGRSDLATGELVTASQETTKAADADKNVPVLLKQEEKKEGEPKAETKENN